MGSEKTTDAAASDNSSAAAGPTGFFQRTFQAFGYRDFRLMWAGAFTSTTGTWMQSVAQSWLVLEMTGSRSAFFLGLLGFLGDLPIMLFSLIGGVVADRIDRRMILLGSQYVQMTCAFILTLLVYFKVVHIGHMMVLVFVAGTAMSFGGPAYQALVPGLVERKVVPNAVALNSIQFNLARVVGPLIAGVTMAAFGSVTCFFLNGLSFLAVIAGLYLIRATFLPQKTAESVLESVRSGFTFIRKRGALWQLSVLGFVSTFCGIPLLTLLPVIAKNTYHFDAKGYSYLLSISGIGSILGALIYAGLAQRRNHGLLALRVQLVFAVLLAIFAMSHFLPIVFLCLFCCGMCLITLFSAINSLVQLSVTEEMRGRVMSIFMLAFRGGMPLGNLVAGYFASKFSPSQTLFALGCVLAATALAFLMSNSGIKKL
ncbi:MAG TPA: MFS transporter [Acidobacteriota bacterium]|nr:MFS transporter [Acidobacteriota bacterium]